VNSICNLDFFAFVAVCCAQGACIAPLNDLRSPRYWLLLCVPALAYVLGRAA
jgi:hypothetical protein